MENQTFEKNRIAFPDQYKYLLQNKRYADALVLSLERLREFPMDADAYVAVGEAQIAMAHLTESQRMLCALEDKIAALTGVFVRMGELYAKNGYAKEAQLCYQQYRAYSPFAEKGRALTSPGTASEDVQKKESKIDQQDNASSDQLINTLSGWLTNINRTKTHAACNR